MSNDQTKIDLTKPEGIQAYLKTCLDGRFAAKSVEALSGGSANFAFRAWLEDPSKAKTTDASVSSGAPDSALAQEESVIVKYSTDYAASYPGIHLNLDRTDVEAAALRLVSESFYAGNNNRDSFSKVHVPYLFHYDQQNRIQIITDFGSLPSLKEYIIAHPEDNSIAEEVGKQLGPFLAALHIWGFNVLNDTASSSQEGNVMEIFENNGTSRQLCSWRTSGRLADVAKEYLVGTSTDWDAIVKALGKDVVEGNETFNMGDFWTGNVLVKTSPGATASLEGLVVIDWELAKTGFAATDIAQFSAESYMLHRLASPLNPAGGILVASFLSAYAQSLTDHDTKTKIDLASKFFDSNSIMSHLAAHAAVWGHSVSWAKDDEASGVSGKEITSRMVQRALEICLLSSKNGYDSAGLDVQQRAKRLVDELVKE